MLTTDCMRFIRLRGSLSMAGTFLVVSGLMAACSSSESGPAAPGTVSLDGVSLRRGTTVLRFTATVRNTHAKSLKTLDSVELDTGDGTKRATSIRTCEGSDVAPWLVKGGQSATVEFTVKNNGPDRMAVEAYCFEGGKQSSRTALWEFQTFAKIDTNASGKISVAMNGTLDDGSVWTATGSGE
jgi:hypothetical protein